MLCAKHTITAILFICIAQLTVIAATPVQLTATLKAKARYGIFRADETIDVVFSIRGKRTEADTLQWTLRNYLGQQIETGQTAIPAGNSPYAFSLEMRQHGSGCFDLYAELKNAKVSLPKLGTRPAGIISYGVLPRIEALSLQSPQDSRFGIQGTTFVQSGKFMQGDQYNPYYACLGVKWCYLNRRLQELEASPGAYHPKTTAEQLKHSWRYLTEGKLATIVDAHSVPCWLMADSKPQANPRKASPSFYCQKYAPRDFAEYGELMGKVAREQAAARKSRFKFMRNTYYQIHWEPDWHWLGTDAEYIQMYKTAYEAIHANDPAGKLTGCNYGLLKTGNSHLERLFKQGLGNYIDVLTTHVYYKGGGMRGYTVPPEVGIIPGMRRIMELKKKYLKPEAKLYQTEWGVNWGADYLKESVPRQILLKELAWTLRAHLIILGEGADATWFFYAADLGRAGGGFAYNLDKKVKCGAVNISPKPVTMGAATLTRLLEGTQTLACLDYLDDNILGYAFQRKNSTMLALWATTDEPEEIMLNVGSPNVTIYDAMGNVQQATTVGDQLKLELTQVPIYVLGFNRQLLPTETISAFPGETIELDKASIIASRGTKRYKLTDGKLPEAIATGTWLLQYSDGTRRKVEIKSPFRLSARQTLKSGKPGLNIRLKNLTPRPIEGTLTTPSEQQLGKLNALPGKETTLFVPIATLPATPMGAGHQIIFTDSHGHQGQITVASNEIINAFKVASPPIPDADIREWQLEMYTQISGRDALAYKEAPWKDASDLSVLYAVAYDNRALYLALKVRDQIHQYSSLADLPWRSDSIQVAVADPAEINNRKCLSFELKPNGTTDIKLIKGTLHPEVGRPPNGISGTVRRDDETGTTLYEIALPWQHLGYDAVPAGKLVGLGILVNDADTQQQVDKDARKTIAITGGAGLFQASPVLGVIPIR